MQTQVTRQLPYITTVSENSRRDIASAFGISEKRIKVVRNGIDSDIFQPMPTVVREPYHLITTASADQPLKGTQHLIPAVADLAARHPDLKLTFIGAPKPGGKTEQLIQSLQLEGHIEFHHGLSFDEIKQLYAKRAWLWCRRSAKVSLSCGRGYGLRRTAGIHRRRRTARSCG